MSEGIKFRTVGGRRLRWLAGGGALGLMATLYFALSGPEEVAKVELEPIPDAPAEVAPDALAQGATATSPTPPPVPTDPNLLGGSPVSSGEESLVPKSDLYAMRDRALFAERKLESERAETRRLTERIADLEGQIEAERIAQLPPPPTSSQQIITTLAPVLSGSR